MTPPPAITRTLYRSLLRTARRYGQSPVLCSLLHRTGRADRWDPTQGPYLGGRSRGRSSGAKPSDDDIPEEELQSVHVPADSARDLTRGYDELRRNHYRRAREAGLGAAPGGDEAGGSEGSGNVIVEGTASDDGAIKIQIVPSDELDKQLEEYVMSKFSTSEGNARPSHEVLFRRLLRDVMGGGDAQLRFPSQIVAKNDAVRLEEMIKREFRASSLGEWDGADKDLTVPPVSAYFDNDTRREAAFLALRELNKKLVWAESLGLNLRSSFQDDDKDKDENGNPLPKRNRQAAKDVHALPTNPPSSYLRAGSFLVAHPLMPGYFSKSVIAILEHTDPHAASNNIKGEEEEGNLAGGGGTYGVIVNRPSLSSLPTSSGGFRTRALREVLRPDCLPDVLRHAFGDSPVREGGPVNVAVQMMHTANPDTEEKLNLGGTVLPFILPDDRDEQFAQVSAAVDSDSAVFFNADLIKASQAVLEGDMDRDDFTFLVGASVWSVGQLESEIERGFWLPCRGPPQIAYSGMCEHSEEVDDKSPGATVEDEKRKKKERPKPDLWLSMMCAIGENEAQLAQLILDADEHDVNGEACDDF